jgi:hypothetical protein
MVLIAPLSHPATHGSDHVTWVRRGKGLANRIFSTTAWCPDEKDTVPSLIRGLRPGILYTLL